MTGAINLCIQSDDFGMHPAINDGIVRAFCDGLLTDANIMAPCPAFRAAAALARQHSIPTGLHATLTCDWDLYRWGPLTNAPSLTTPEGYFKHLVSAAFQDASDDEVQAELTAQVDAMEAEGMRSTHASYHMGHDGKGRLFRALRAIGPQRTGPVRIEQPSDRSDLPAYRWDSAFFTSHWSLNPVRRRARLKARLRALQPGYHLWMVHAAEDHPSLDSLCSRDYFAWNWARPYRAADMALLMDPEIRDLIEALGIRRIPITAAPLEALS